MPQPTRWTRCTAQKESGRFCDDPTITGAPFPICYRHAGQLYAFCRDRLEFVTNDPEMSLEAIADIYASRYRHTKPDSGSDGIIYYLLVGDLIKIGTTTRLAARLKAYPPNRRLLATESGGWALENKLHVRFEHLLDSGREWFKPGPDLVEHINKLRRRQGAPQYRPRSA